jgi:hypothetical protein
MGRERKRLGFGDEVQRLWFVARISNIGRWGEKTSGRHIGLASGLALD